MRPSVDCGFAAAPANGPAANESQPPPFWSATARRRTGAPKIKDRSSDAGAGEKRRRRKKAKLFKIQDLTLLRLAISIRRDSNSFKV